MVTSTITNIWFSYEPIKWVGQANLSPFPGKEAMI